MGLVHGDEKAAGTMRAFHRGEENHPSRPTVDSLFLAVGTLQLMLIKVESNKVGSGELGLRHDFTRREAAINNGFLLALRISGGQGTVGTPRHCPACAGRPQRLRLFRMPFRNLPYHESVAFAGRFFHFWPVDDLHVPTTVGDESRLL